MTCTKRKSIFAVRFISLAIILYNFTFTQGDGAQSTAVRCLEREREALLEFKKGVFDEDGILSSWGSDDEDHERARECCKWWGVRCSDGHVTVLDLHCPVDDHGFLLQTPLRGKVSPSLLQLQHLGYLDLSYNDFQGHNTPDFIGSLHSLRVLNLSSAMFSGKLPNQLGNLTNLQVLDLSGNDFLPISSLEFLSHLSSLKYIDLTALRFELREFVKTSVTLPNSLEELKLSFCELTDLTIFSANSSSSTSLSVVDLSLNNLTSPSVFKWLQNFNTTLTTIDLSHNDNLGGSIPDAFQGMKFLRSFNLSSNYFTGGIPNSLGNLSHLTSLELNFNVLKEPLPDLLEKLSKRAGKSLQFLRLDGNELFGPLPDIRTQFPFLRKLKASYNHLNGSLPSSFGSLEELKLASNEITGLFPDNRSLGVESGLRVLDLSQNKITGSLPDLSPFSSMQELLLGGNQLRGVLPESIGQLSKLHSLDVSENSFEGVINEAHFLKLSNLKLLKLSFNSGLSFNFSPDWNPPFQLQIIHFKDCKLGPNFPKWLRTQSGFSELDISSTGISDTMPNWFWDLCSKVEYLALSNNKIDGELPDLSTKFGVFPEIDLSHNNFRGPIHSLPPKVKSLYLSNNSFVGSISFVCRVLKFMSIDLSDNQFSGEIPDCWHHLSRLNNLNLANNNFSGKVPPSFGYLYYLKELQLRNNNFTGELPSSLQNCTLLRILDLGRNQLTGRVPSWFGTSLVDLIIVSLRENRFFGELPQSLCHLNDIHVLDLSQNRITGRIPHCLSNFTYLSLIHSSFGTTIASKAFFIFQNDIDSYMSNILIQWKYNEREYSGRLRLLKLIDLSSNLLVGDIPKEFSNLHGLISLNLSRNQLTGKINREIGQMEMLESLDLSHNQLSGEIPVSLGGLSFLQILDLSNNNLSGKIPSSTQMQSFNASSYAHNSGLCGDPLPKCPRNVPNKDEDEDEDEDDGLITQGFYISMVLGFSLSFWGFLVIFFFKGSWRDARTSETGG
ncbi:PREDICTED: receptor-like protein 12 [Ipomoea nil]|uniref:receptor-like protein 12 n=1 Tax=Ipomoea nil TaxID=35883 RepID=UPI000900F5C9|nr:PREDICTED: receptor-like protein 12 [Ipomoea nil]